jgi:hypothetical protein
MVHCGVTPPYLSPSHPTKGDDSGRGSRDRDVLGSYTWRCRDIGGLVQVQSQLANLMIQLQDMAKTKVMHEHVWCTTCHSEGHHRDEFPILPNYVVIGAPSPFPSGQSEWCEICRKWGHVPPIVPHCRNTRQQLTLHSVSSVNPLAMMSIVFAPSS